jgi:beta-lactamase class A
MDKEKQHKIFFLKVAAVMAVCLLAGIVLGRFSSAQKLITKVDHSDDVKEIRSGGYKYINPLLECNGDELNFTELKPFSDKVNALVNEINQQNKDVNSVAVYFRDLNNGPWFGIGNTLKFLPASLLKVPMMIYYFNRSEDEPDVLKQTYTFNENDQTRAIVQLIPPSESLQEGQSYTVDDLITRMIKFSDNKALYLLNQHADINALAKVYEDFGVDMGTPENPSPSVTVQKYASFFRVLYNASYLDRNFSEKALGLLANAEFNDGLVAGVPQGVTVAHKFGEREVSGISEKQLHDCGIVYYPNHPYLLCVMSRGNKMDELANSIKQVSALVYSEVDKQNH